LVAAVWSFYVNVVDPHDGAATTLAAAGSAADSGTAELDGATTTAGVSAASTASTAADDRSTDTEATDMLPESIGGWGLTARLTGPEAMVDVEQLHGKDLGAGVVDAWVGVYGADAGRPAHATLWVSRSPDDGSARELYVRMTERIRDGNSPFTGLRPIEDVDVEGFALDGMGQMHYYFLIGNDLYWLAVDVEAAPAALAEIVSGASARTAG
jgi:hypothetical protein